MTRKSMLGRIAAKVIENAIGRRERGWPCASVKDGIHCTTYGWRCSCGPSAMTDSTREQARLNDPLFPPYSPRSTP